MKYDQLVKELKHKERTINDLISYIATRSNDMTPNYSFLLGAGSSVTSGIRTGQNLVDEWRREIYLRMTGESETEYEQEKAKNYFLTNGGAWYSLSNEYSSLFEKNLTCLRKEEGLLSKKLIINFLL